MKVKLDSTLITVDGKVWKENGKEILIKDILLATALGDLDKEDKAKLDDFNLFLKIKEQCEEIELIASECARLQDKAKKMYGTLIFGQINAILEGKENPLKLIENKNESHDKQVS